jgi:hypothetical protein
MIGIAMGTMTAEPEAIDSIVQAPCPAKMTYINEGS